LLPQKLASVSIFYEIMKKLTQSSVFQQGEDSYLSAEVVDCAQYK